MPLTVPPFSQYQGQLVPLRGLWNTPPKEGDYFVNAEIGWGSQNTDAVQFALSGNSPVALSQIVALYVDNRRCGVDADFLFPDSGFLLTVPARAQGLFPVLTNALMFYAIGQGAGGADTTIVQILNSLPPPIPMLPTESMNSAGATAINAGSSATVPIILPPTNGTIDTISITSNTTSPAGIGQQNISLRDGTGATVWVGTIGAPVAGASGAINLTGLNLRFINGLSLVTAASGGIVGSLAVNVYYSSP